MRIVEIEDKIPELVRTDNGGAMISISDSFYPIILQAGFSEISICKIFSTVQVGSRGLKSSMFVKRGNPLKEYFNIK